MRPPRVILAKPGLDGHDRGIKVVAMGLRDAGAEVVYLGLRTTPGQIAVAAAAEDADVVGISVLSGAHLAITEELLAALRRERADTPLVVGGTIPARDADTMRDLGVAAVFPAGTPLPDVVAGVLEVAGSRTPAHAPGVRGGPGDRPTGGQR
jgi:methylmalonyl-CoA mutase, C-terminal domain